MKCEFCDNKAPKKSWVPIRVRGKKRAFMVLKVCDVHGIIIKTSFPQIITQFLNRCPKKIK